MKITITISKERLNFLMEILNFVQIKSTPLDSIKIIELRNEIYEGMGGLEVQP